MTAGAYELSKEAIAKRMIRSIIQFSVTNKIVIGLFVFGLVIAGIYSLRTLPINSIPDSSNNQVRVITVSPDLATKEVEQLITYPVEQEMANLPGVKHIRSVSKFGLSVVTVIFKDDMGKYLPRQLIQEKIKTASEQIPEGLGQPRMGPIISGLGEIYQWVVTTEKGYDSAYSTRELRSIQDWIVKRQMAGIEGVVEINSWGGYLKQYEVAVDPTRLKSLDITISEVYEALQENNANAGGSYIQKESRAYYIRGEGLVKSLKDIRNIQVTTEDGYPVFIRDLAKVQYGHATRLGATTHNGKGEVVAGQAMMLKGANSWQVIQRVKDRMAEVKKTLPEGVKIKPFIDRSNLITATTTTVSENLALGGLIVILVLLLLLGNWRSGLIVASVIPLSMLFALLMMKVFSINANLMSLGAIDFGIIVDGAVIIVEFVVYQLYIKSDQLRGLFGRERQQALDQLTVDSSSRMMRTAFFGQVIILIVFVPILTLTGAEGKMFRPMALTFGFALIGAMILCLTYVPMMASLLIKPGARQEGGLSNRLIDAIDRVYQPVIRGALRYRYAVLGSATGLLIITLVIFFRMGAVFLPQLDEGSIVIHPILQPGTSLKQTVKTNTQIEKILLEKFPDEVDQVVSRSGTGEIPADPMSLEMTDMFVSLHADDQWTRAADKAALLKQMREELQVIPGVTYSFSQPIEMLVSQFQSGVRSDIAIKIFGDDLNILQQKGDRVETLLQEVKGIQSIKVEKVTGLPQMVVDYQRQRMGKYGISIQQANRALSTAFSGASAGMIYEGQRRYDMTLRLQEQERQSIHDIRNLQVETNQGNQVPLSAIAAINYETGPAQISREQIQRRIVVGVNTGERDVASLIEAIRQKLDQELALPPGYYTTYGGDFENLQQAQQRLLVVVPLALGLILLLLFITFNSIKQSLMVFAAIPLAAIGGVFALYLRGMPFSISAAVGFIALSGIAVLNGIVLVSFFNELKASGTTNKFRRVIKGTRMRLRPVLLTASTDALGFLPMAISASTGAEVQRPLATVVIGGLTTAFLLTMVVLPVIYTLLEGKGKHSSEGPARSGAGASLVALPFLFLIPGSAQAQEAPDPITLDQAIDKAMANHPAIQEQKYSVQRQEALQGATFDLPKTRIFIGQEEARLNSPRAINSIGASQRLSLPMVYQKASQLQNERLSLANRQQSQVRQQQVKQVRQAYYQLQYGYARLSLYQRLDSVFANYQKAADIRYETGETGKLEQLASETRYQQLRVKLNQARSDLQVYHQQLQQAVNTSDTLVLADQEPKPLPAPGLPDSAALEQNPRIQVKEQAVNKAQAAYERQRAELWPALSLTYRAQTVNGQSGFYGFMAGLRVPLAFWSYDSRNEAAEIQIARQEAKLANLANETQSRIRQQRIQVRQYQKQLAFYQEQRLQQAEQLLSTAGQQYEQGAITYPVYAQYTRQALRIQVEYLKTLNQYNQAVIRLSYLIGQQ